MIRIVFVVLLTLAAVSCGLDRQARALRALEKCEYAFVSADSMSLAGTDVSKIITGNRLNVSQLPSVAFGFLNRDVPLSGLLNVRITNPTNHLAGIQEFAYKIAIEGNEVVEGTSDLPIEVPAGETAVVPIKLQANVYKFLSDKQTLQKLLSFLQSARDGNTEEQIKLTFMIKPTIALGNKQIDYPNYISVDKQIDAGFLLKNNIVPKR